MKTLFTLAFLLFSLSAFADTVKITAYFEGVEEPTTIYFRDIGKEISFSIPIYLDSAITDASGNLEVELDLGGPTTVLLQGAIFQRMLFLEPGDALSFTVPAEFRAELKDISGSGVEKVSVLNRLKDYLNFLTLIQLDSAEMIPQAKEDIKALYELEKEVMESNFSEAFKTYFRATALHSQIYFWNVYPMYAKSYKKMELPRNEEKIQEITQELMDFGRSGYISHEFREDYLNLIRRDIYNEKKQDAKPADFYEYLKTIDLPEEGKQMYEGMLLLSDFKRGNIIEAEPFMAEFMEKYPSSKYIGFLNDEYKSWEKLAVGQPAPDFTATDIEGNTFQLSDLKGNVVYIDIWATWCGPCIGEFPSAKKLKKEFEEEKKLVFLYVSVDDQEDRWKTFLEKEPEFTGMHVHDPGNFNSNIAKLYKVEGIPRYLMIDHEGKIANIQAPRPSNTEITSSELKKLLQAISE